MPRAFRLILLLAVIISPEVAFAQSWSVGSNLGMSTIQSVENGTGSTTVLARPSNTLTYQPALRVGVGDERHGHEANLDSGLLMLDEAGSTVSLLLVMLSYEYCYRSSGSTSPFANVGYG